MSRYIDADKLICAIDGAESLDTERDYDEIARFIEEAETADVEEVRHGYWVQPHFSYKPFCSECKTFEQTGEKKKYCSECGAKMDKERNNE